jgi:hypothetical protein
MPAPGIDPNRRASSETPKASSYQRGARVWVYRGGTWRPGLIEGSSEFAAMVTYRPAAHRGTAVDTVTAVNLAGRVEDDMVDDSSSLHARLQAPEQPVAPRQTSVDGQQ